jgi:hypothetical protein
MIASLLLLGFSARARMPRRFSSRRAQARAIREDPERQRSLTNGAGSERKAEMATSSAAFALAVDALHHRS